MNEITFAAKTEALRDASSKRFEIFLPDGCGKISYDGKEISFGGDEILIIPPLARYSLSCGGLLIALDRAMLPVHEITILKDDGAKGLRHAATQAERYFSSPVAKGDLVLSALGDLLAAYVSALSGTESLSPAVKLVRDDIDKNVSNCAYSLDGFIKSLPLNYDYVRKLFKKETGATPHGYLLKRRMELAQSLILSGISNRYSDYSMSQVAEACGYSEPLYFSRVFKKYFGEAPSEYAASRK